MSSRLTAPVLSVDAGLLHTIDTSNPKNLFTLWTLFSKCSSAMDQGQRLENLSWRIWTRETFCCQPTPSRRPVVPRCSKSLEGLSTADVPSLSGSFDSLVDEDVLEFDRNSSTSDPLNIRPRIRRPSSVSSRSRGRERHITPDGLEKMVMTIKEEKQLEPLDMYIPTPLEAIPEPVGTISAEAPDDSKVTINTPPIPSGSDTSINPTSSTTESMASVRSTTSIVRGFSPAHPSSSYRSSPLLTAPSSIPAADLAAENTTTTKDAIPKKPPKFALGASSGEDSVTEKAQSIVEAKPAQKKKPVFSFGGSSNEDESSLPSCIKPRSALSASIHQPLKKQTAFHDEVASRTIHEDQALSDDVFETDDDEIDESAIEEDDSSDWEDSIEDTVSPDPKTFSFQRVDSRPHLTSRRSMITTLLHQSDRAAELANVASKSTPAIQLLPLSRNTSPNGPSVGTSLVDEDSQPLPMEAPLKTISEVPRSAAQPIIATTTNTTPHFALSARTTRRNMLAHELTVSLRHNLLWERQHVGQFKRRHTAHDLANLKQYPENMENGSINVDDARYFESGVGEYNAQGW